MPTKPKRPCSYPGCPRLTSGRFCEEHAKQEARRYEKYDRDPATRRRYGRAWKRIRERYIAAHPLCEKCREQGKLTPAQEVHHILPLSRGGTHDETNSTQKGYDRYYHQQIDYVEIIAQLTMHCNPRGGLNLCNFSKGQRAWGSVRKK